jgi:Sec-independent protein secretion pathway component TatC
MIWFFFILLVSFFIPPEPLTQLCTTFPILFFYELWVYLGYLKNRLFQS